MNKDNLLLAVPKTVLRDMLVTQIKSLFLLDTQVEPVILEEFLPMSLDRVTYCFSHSTNKYYRREGQVFFNPLHTAQYGIFLYYLANTIWRERGHVPLCDKLYALGKVINAIDLFYEVEMPDVFFMDHPVGTVLGRAQYGRFFSFTQNCTVGNNRGLYPIIGEYVSMKCGASIIGNCRIGNRVIIAAGASVKDQEIPDCCLVFGSSPNLILKHRPMDYFDCVPQ